MINRVLQLNNIQLESSFNSFLEKHFVLDFPNQPNPNTSQSVIERGNLLRRKFLWREEKTSHSQEIYAKRLQEELGSSDRTVKPAEVHTQSMNLIFPDIVILHRQTRTSSTLRSMRKTSTSTFQVCRTR